MSENYQQPKALDYEKLGVEPPSSVSHGVTPDDVRAQMKRLTCTNWRLMGNELLCDTEHGTLSQIISPDYILMGTGDDGLPILKKIKV
jgi:hypothetical protein